MQPVRTPDAACVDGGDGRVEAEQDGGVTIAEIACRLHHLEPVEGGLRCWPVGFQHVGKGGACRSEIRACRSDGGCTHDGSGGLTEGAGLYVMCEAGDASVRDIHVHRDHRSAERCAHAGGPHGRIETPHMGDVRRQREDCPGIQIDQRGVGHGRLSHRFMAGYIAGRPHQAKDARCNSIQPA